MVINNDDEIEIEPKPEPKPEHNENNQGDKHPLGGWKQAHERMKESMETKFAKEWGSNKCGSIAKSEITDKTAKYLRLGSTQNPRKIEMAKCGAATTKKRGQINPTK